MKRARGKLTYANVIATLALFLALGGGAWALSRNSVGTKQIRDGAVRTKDVRNKNLRGRDLKANTVRGGQVRESTLDLGQLTGMKSNARVSCNPISDILINCVSVALRFPTLGRALLIATGGGEGVGSTARGACQLRADGRSTPFGEISARPGEEGSGVTSRGATNGFAITDVSQRLGRGTHTFALFCNQTVGDLRVHDLHISALMLRDPG